MPTVLGVVTIIFLLRPLIPGDPIDFILGEMAFEVDRNMLEKEFHLDEPLYKQYLLFLASVARGDLGRSIQTREPVIKMIISRYPQTIKLTFAAMLAAILISLPTGIIAALKKDTLIDQGSLFFAMLGLAMPNFWLGPLLIIVFSIKLGWLPVSGQGGLSYLILPAATLGTSMAAILARMTRASILEVIDEDYIVTAKAKGVSSIRLIFWHLLPNALLPVITLVGLQLGALLAGSIITETIFAWDGLGRLLIGAINARDFPLVQGCVLTISLSYVLINLITDIAYFWIDPRIRLPQ